MGIRQAWPAVGALCAVLAAQGVRAQNTATLVFTFLDEQSVLYDATEFSQPDFGSVLTGGVQAATGDGAFLELLVETSPEEYLVLSNAFRVGDGLETFPAGAHNGRYSIQIVLSPADAQTYSGRPLHVRYYNRVTIGTSTFYGQITNPDWTVPYDPVNPTFGNFEASDADTTGLLNYALESPVIPDGTLAPANGLPDGFYTNIQVPEPSVVLLAALGAGAIAGRRRRR